MKSTARILVLLAVAMATIYGATVKKPAGVQCVNNLDCAPGYCCTIGYERYSLPTCNRLLVSGETCRPGGPMVTNGSRYYPDGSGIVLGNIYMMMCPCSPELVCDRGSCRDAGETNDLDHLAGLPAHSDD